MAVLRSSACTEDHRATVTQAKRLYVVQLGISYQTLQDIRCNASTDAVFGKALADRKYEADI